ncbi:tetratricopeptide repeat protein [Mucilaginibacter paludis]|uniref:Tetratricopeptide TPR_1 repeat-containing protein n=1 Tax=Mucilaginibacter paludis DSM 18603 TaxID=714943 RepID=H1Y510_9SPHI|nr:tetratricopeptide repeat protein [Mucilaginibacter paludis]EHQ28338.1 Tetratricopeptide TPR_1 repeat-containing protein [Mucilaginibacter paludis DSM 18603]
MNKGFIISLLVCSFAARPVLAQFNDPKFVVVAAKPMSYSDSNMVKQLFFSALREKTIESYTLAAELFNRILQIDPANDASMFELAKIKKIQNNEAGARELFERAVTVNRDNKYYWIGLAESYEKTNDLVKLENVFNELTRLDPDNPEYLFDKANAYFIEKRYDEALAIYDQLEKRLGLNDDIIANRQKIYLKQGKIDKAAAELEEMIKANPDQMRYYLLLSEIYNSNGFNDKALKVLEKAEKVNSNSGMIHLALADVYKDKKEYSKSFDQVKQAFTMPDLSIEQELNIIMGYLPKFPDADAKASSLELSRILTVTYPNNSKAFAVYGDMLLQNENYKDAKIAYKKSLKLDGQVYVAWEQLVRIELSDNNLDDAIKDGEEALSIFPNQAWMNYLVGVAWLQKKNYNKALSYVSNVPSLETQDKTMLSQAYSAMGDCYHSMKDIKKSDEAYDKSIAYNPDNIYTLNNFAYYLSIRNEDLEKAAQMSKHSNDLQPNTASFEDTYAWILFKQKKYADAKVWIEKAIAHDKQKSAVQIEHYGDILFYLGDIDAAVQNWKKAKQGGSNNAVLDRKINEKKYIE